MGKVIDIFQTKITNLSHSEKYVLHFIDNDLKLANDLTLIQMAEHISVSTTTIIRMCQKLGLGGFSELKFLLKTIKSDFHTFQTATTSYPLQLLNTLNNLDFFNIKKIAHLLISTQKVYIFSLGLSKMLGEYFSRLLQTVDKVCTYIYDSIHSSVHLPTIDDIVIIISASGETEILLSVAEKMKYSNIKLISITNSPDNSLNRICDISVCTNITEQNYRNRDTTPRSAMMFLIDSIINSFLLEKDNL